MHQKKRKQNYGKARSSLARCEELLPGLQVRGCILGAQQGSHGLLAPRWNAHLLFFRFLGFYSGFLTLSRWFPQEAIRMKYVACLINYSAGEQFHQTGLGRRNLIQHCLKLLNKWGKPGKRALGMNFIHKPHLLSSQCPGVKTLGCCENLSCLLKLSWAAHSKQLSDTDSPWQWVLTSERMKNTNCVPSGVKRSLSRDQVLFFSLQYYSQKEARQFFLFPS